MNLNWRKVSFSGLMKTIIENESLQNSLKRFDYFPSVLVYGIEFIFLLKLSQIVLGWHF